MSNRELSCPREGSRLVTESYEGVEIDRCGECEGVWLDKGELEAIQQSPGYADSELAANPSTEPVSTKYVVAQQDRRELGCPACGGTMERREHGYASQIVVDACVAGCGLWLDKGELQALERFYEEASEGTELPLHWRIWASLVSKLSR